MNIRCPQCKRLFEYDPEAGPARCTYEDCGWEFKRSEERAEPKSEIETIAPETETVSLSVESPSTAVAVKTGHQELERRRQSAPVHTIRCPACRSMIPDDSVTCPVCDIHLDEAFSRQDGVRAVFDVSGDITFTPKMVAILFIATLGAFLAFTWIISGRGKDDNIAPIVLTSPAQSAAAGEHVSSLQGVEFAQLKKEFLDPRLTDVRREALTREFTGERVIWNGVVTSVEPNGQAYRIEVMMGEPDTHGFVTVDALNHEANERRVLELRRGDEIMFSGSIRAFHKGGAYDPLDFFRIELANGLLLN